MSQVIKHWAETGASEQRETPLQKFTSSSLKSFEYDGMGAREKQEEYMSKKHGFCFPELIHHSEYGPSHDS